MNLVSVITSKSTQQIRDPLSTLIPTVAPQGKMRLFFRIRKGAEPDDFYRFGSHAATYLRARCTKNTLPVDQRVWPLAGTIDFRQKMTHRDTVSQTIEPVVCFGFANHGARQQHIAHPVPE